MSRDERSAGRASTKVRGSRGVAEFFVAKRVMTEWSRIAWLVKDWMGGEAHSAFVVVRRRCADSAGVRAGASGGAKGGGPRWLRLPPPTICDAPSALARIQRDAFAQGQTCSGEPRMKCTRTRGAGVRGKPNRVGASGEKVKGLR